MVTPKQSMPLRYNNHETNVPHYNDKKCLMKESVRVYNELMLVPCLQLALKVIFRESIFLESRSLIYLLGDTALEMQHQRC